MKRTTVIILMVILMSALYATSKSQVGLAHIKGHGDVTFHQSAGTTNYTLKVYTDVAVPRLVVSNKTQTKATVTALDMDSHEVTDTIEVRWELWK